LAKGALTEEAVHTKTGIPRDVLAVLRRTVLEKGAEWELIKKEVVLSAAGATKVVTGFLSLKVATAEDVVRLLEPPKVVLNEKEAAPRAVPVEEGPPLHELVVWRVPPVTPLIVLARRPEDKSRPPKEILTVRVSDSRNFIPGTIVYATKVEGTLYRLHGRAPRYRGERLYRTPTPTEGH
jgi:hypothetical protein